MALKSGQGFVGNDNLVFLSPRGKDADGNQVKPYFSISRIVDGKIAQTDETCDQIDGSLFKVELAERVYKEIPTRVVNLFLKDGEEAYMLGLTYTSASRSLFNALISLEDNFDNLSISFYRNKKGYEAYSIKQGENRVDWKYTLEQLPQPKEVVINRQKQRDWSETDEFFDAELTALSERIHPNNASGEGAEEQQNDSIGDADDSAAQEQVAPEVPAPTPAPKPAVRPVAQRQVAPANKPAARTATPARTPAKPLPKPTPSQDVADEDVPF